MEQQKKPTNNSYNTLDDCVQASIRTLELVKHSQCIGESSEPLSQFEVESASRSLDQVICTAESIKDELRNHGDISLQHTTDVAKGQENTTMTISKTVLPSNTTKQVYSNVAEATTMVESNSKTSPSEDSTHNTMKQRARKLSTPCLTAIEPIEVIFISQFTLSSFILLTQIHTAYFISPSMPCLRQEGKPPKRAFTTFFDREKTPAIYPSDVEIGKCNEKWRLRFSQAPQREDSSGWKMVLSSLYG